jgi:uncharacterized membrane protein
MNSLIIVTVGVLLTFVGLNLTFSAYLQGKIKMDPFWIRLLGINLTFAGASLTTLREKLVKIGARIVRHGRYIVFQLAEVAVPRALFAEILRRIDRLRPEPRPA